MPEDEPHQGKGQQVAGDAEQRKYDQFILVWHDLRKQTEEMLGEEDEQTAKTWNMFLLNLFFVTPYDTETEFYPQFEARMEKVNQVLAQM